MEKGDVIVGVVESGKALPTCGACLISKMGVLLWQILYGCKHLRGKLYWTTPWRGKKMEARLQYSLSLSYFPDHVLPENQRIPNQIATYFWKKTPFPDFLEDRTDKIVRNGGRTDSKISHKRYHLF